MDWKDIGRQVAAIGLPVLGTVLGGPAGAKVGSLAAAALGVADDPSSVYDAVNANPEAVATLRKLELDNSRELTRMHLEAESANLAQVNQTMRAELTSTDSYNRRWRATWGYCTAAAWVVQMFGLMFIMGYAVIKNPNNVGSILTGLEGIIGATLGLWFMALTVLGVNIRQRSKDKEVAAGSPPAPGAFGALIGMLGRKD